MGSTRTGSVRDFVAVGDVDIRVIGAECDIPDCQAPVRLLLGSLSPRQGIPPFLLGLNWSSTERMSSQQADIMTSELTALRRTLTPGGGEDLRPVEKDSDVQVEWEEINLQDQVEEARAALYRQQARQLEGEQPHPAQPGATENAWRGGDPWRQYGNRPERKLTLWRGELAPSTPWGTPA